jgi:large subunit ribosomal protein L6
MSRIGNKPVNIPQGVEVNIKDKIISVKGPKGQLEETIMSDDISCILEEDNIIISRTKDEIQIKAFHGLYRSLIQNMVIGVSTGFEKKLRLIGTGYRAQNKGKSLELNLGFSHPITIEPIGENKLLVEEQTLVTVEGINKEHVGRQAAKIRILRKPNPYTGKGIKYNDEQIRRKTGKSAVGAGEGAP